MDLNRSNAGRLVVGLFLIVVGGLALLAELGLADLGSAWRLWPVLLIGLGLAKLLWPAGGAERWNAVWLLAVGLWAGANLWHLWRLSWHDSWPVLLVVGGGLMVARALFGTSGPCCEAGDVR